MMMMMVELRRLTLRAGSSRSSTMACSVDVAGCGRQPVGGVLLRVGIYGIECVMRASRPTCSPRQLSSFFVSTWPRPTGTLSIHKATTPNVAILFSFLL